MKSDDLSLLFKALSEPLRLRLLNLIREAGDICVCDLVTVLGVSQSMVSRHLAYLRSCGWVDSRREGLWMHYRLVMDDHPLKQDVMRAIAAHVARDVVLNADLERLKSSCRSSGCC